MRCRGGYHPPDGRQDVVHYEYIITITDDGKGIDSKNLQNIFTRYYKGEDGHFGIGLAVVKSSADYLGADVKVESEEGKGTSFVITI